MASLRPVPSRTLARPVTIEGVGLFCPDHCRVTILPSPSDMRPGLFFQRADVHGAPCIPASPSRVIARPRQTVLAPAEADHRGATVQTIEHIMSALIGLGVSDALIMVHGPEIPLVDGSALPFARAILEAGIVDSPGKAARQPIVIREPFTLEERGTVIHAAPQGAADGPAGPRFTATYVLDYGPGAPIAPQQATFTVRYASPDRDSYICDIAPARTFATQSEAEQLRAAGMFTHLSPTDVPVIGPGGPIVGAARFADEPARHKVLDLIGDLGLAGRPIHGCITATRSGHALNHAMAAALAAL